MPPPNPFLKAPKNESNAHLVGRALLGGGYEYLSQRGKAIKNNVQDKRIKQLEKKVRKLKLQKDRKFLDVYSTSITPSTTMGNHHYTAITQGDGVGERANDKVILNSFMLNYSIKKHASADDTQVRLVLVYFPTAGSLSTNDNVFEKVTDATGQLLSPFKIDGKTPYRILMDETHNLKAEVPRIVKYKKFKGPFELKFNDDESATVPVRGRIYLFYMSNEGTNTPTVSNYSRMKWDD